MLKVATHGRMGALDLRLLGRDPGENAKLVVAAGQIAAIHHANADRTYPDQARADTGDDPTNQHGIAGSLQLVFCDLGTPQPRTRTGSTGLAQGWNVYDELKTLLVKRGVPADKIRYVHEARNDKEKGEMFAAARNGRIAVLLGSTEKMGVGTNVQARAIALHHLDCPWRPADIAQREGRILRQGNLNPEVEITRYVSEGSFDAYLWQTVERKARFIGQVMRGRLDVREIEDIGDTALSYAEVKALATGDPRILDKARTDAEMTRLERLERAHTRNQRGLSATITKAEQDLPRLAEEHRQITEAISRTHGTGGDRFAMTVNGTRWSTRADAAIALRTALAAVPALSDRETRVGNQPVTVAALDGCDITAAARRYLEPHLWLEITDVPRSGVHVDYDELRQDRPLGIITKLENKVNNLDHILAAVAESQATIAAEADRARAQYGQPFPHREALATARSRSAELAADLAEQQQHTRPATAPDSTPQSPDVASISAAASTPNGRHNQALGNPGRPSDLTTRPQADPTSGPLLQAQRPRSGPRR